MAAGRDDDELQRAAAGAALLRLMHGLSTHLSTAASERGLTMPQAMAIDRLDEREPTPMTELARQLRCDTSNLTGIVDRLEDRGLIERITPRTDRRVRAIRLTDAGRRIRQEMAHAVRGGNPLLGRLTVEQCGQLTTLLDRMLDDDVPA